MALPTHSSALAYVHDLVLSIRRNLGTLPPEAADALDALAAIYSGSGATTDLADVFRDAIPPVRRESGFQVVPLARRSPGGAAPAAEERPRSRAGSNAARSIRNLLSGLREQNVGPAPRGDGPKLVESSFSAQRGSPSEGTTSRRFASASVRGRRSCGP